MSAEDSDQRERPSGQFHAGAGFERLLVESAKLDVPPTGAHQRALERARREPSRRHRRIVGIVGIGVAALAAGAALVVGALSKREAPIVTSEPVTPPRSASVALEVPPLPVRPPCPKVTVASGMHPVIDDLEDRNARVSVLDGRWGAWRLYAGETKPIVTPLAADGATIHPSRIPGGRGESRHAMHLLGRRFTSWGLSFNAELAPGGCYDASRYAGVTFWGKGAGRIHVGLRMLDDIERKHGGFCDKDCYDVHQKAVDLGPQFQRFELKWDELKPRVAPLAQGVDPARLSSIDFLIYAVDTPFDVWVDDLAFLER